MYDALQTENPLAKPLAMMKTDTRTKHTNTKQTEYQTTRRKTDPDGTISKATTAPRQPDKARHSHAADAEPVATECTSETTAPHEILHASYVEE